MSANRPNPASAGQPKQTVESLCEEYCPPLEAGLVYALASDFDLDDHTNVRELRKTLEELKDSAVVEQDLELLPQTEDVSRPERERDSSAVGATKRRNDGASSQPSRSSPESTNEDDAINSVTTGLSGLKYSDLEDDDFGFGSGYGDTGVEFKDLSRDQKCKWLANMFPNIEAEDIQNVLDKCSQDFDKSADELLNISFIRESHVDAKDQEYVVPKGIDAFLQGGKDKPQRKAKRKGRRNKLRPDDKDLSDAWQSDSPVPSGLATPNVRKSLPQDIEFIVSRTRLKPKMVTSIYHANGARIAPTIRALAIKEGETYEKRHDRVDQIIQWQIDELRVEFEQVSNAQLYGILMLANGDPSASKDLLDVMTTSNEQPVLLGKIAGLASYTPVNLSDDEAKPKRTPNNNWSSTMPVSGDSYTMSHLANAHGISATEAFQQASAAYRRGKSDHLMGGAAAYYASVGHEKIKAAKSIQAAAADAHVTAQSSSTVLDLHGVNVSDAVRIAQCATMAWWEGLGDRKYVVGGKGDGYRIVTGVGRHSSDGIGRIGPAVSKMLVREGWKVEVGRGEIVVSGRARR